MAVLIRLDVLFLAFDRFSVIPINGMRSCIFLKDLVRVKENCLVPLENNRFIPNFSSPHFALFSSEYDEV